MKNKTSHSVFSTILMVILMLPFVIQSTHALHGHTYEVCDTKDVQHIDQHQTDCSNYHQIIEQNSIDFLSDIDFDINLIPNHNHTHFYQNQYTVNLQLKSSRAPPYFIV